MLVACRKDVHSFNRQSPSDSEVLGAGEVMVNYTVQALVAMELYVVRWGSQPVNEQIHEQKHFS